MASDSCQPWIKSSQGRFSHGLAGWDISTQLWGLELTRNWVKPSRPLSRLVGLIRTNAVFLQWIRALFLGALGNFALPVISLAQALPLLPTHGQQQNPNVPAAGQNTVFCSQFV